MHYAPLNDDVGDRVIASARLIAGATVARAQRRANAPADRAACSSAGPANGACAQTCRSSQAGHTCLKIFRWVMTLAGAGAGETAGAPRVFGVFGRRPRRRRLCARRHVRPPAVCR